MTLAGDQLTMGTGRGDLLPGEMVVLDRRKMRTSIDDLGFERVMVDVGDESDPVKSRELKRRGDELEEGFRENPDWVRPTEENNFRPNPGWDWFYHDEHGNPTAMLEWRKLIPSSMALFAIQRPKEIEKVLPGVLIDEHSRSMLRDMPDSKGIVSRAVVAENIYLDLARRSHEEKLRIVSLGSGAGVPNINATLDIKAQLGKDTSWDFFDTDAAAMQLLQTSARESGIPEEDIHPHIGSYKGAFDLPKESADAVEMLGLWEYLKTKHCEFMLPRLLSIIKPGGSFVASNMLDTRPHRELNQRGIGWTELQIRSVDELVEIAHKAGVDTENDLTITLPQDGVYAVMEIRKP